MKLKRDPTKKAYFKKTAYQNISGWKHRHITAVVTGGPPKSQVPGFPSKNLATLEDDLAIPTGVAVHTVDCPFDRGARSIIFETTLNHFTL